MKRLMMVFASMFLVAGAVLAQTKITGTVVSGDDGEPIIGASVVVQGATGAGAITSTVILQLMFLRVKNL